MAEADWLGSKVGSHLALCYIYQMIRVNSHIGTTMTTHSDYLHEETKMLPVKSHSELLAKHHWLSCFQSHYLCHYLTSQPAPARNMKGMLSKFYRDVVPLRDDDVSEIEQYRFALCNLHSQAVVDAQSDFVPNRVF